MFCVAFMGFCMAYNIGFGDKLYELSTFGSTVIFLIRAFIRDIELMPAYDITPAFGALLILLFYVAMVLVGTIVMFSILANAQFEAKYDKTKEIAAMEAEDAARIHGERRLAFEVNRPVDKTEEQAKRLSLVMELFQLLGSGARNLGAEEQLHLAQLLGIHTTAMQWHGLAEHAAGHWWDEHGWAETPGPTFSQFERFIDDEASPGHCRDDELQRILDRLGAESVASTTLVRPVWPGETRLGCQ